MATRLSALKRNFKWTWLVWAALALLAIAVAVKVWRIGKPAWSLYRAVGQAQAIAANPSAAEAAELPALVHQTRADLAVFQREIRPFYGVLRGLGFLPKIGGDVAAAPALLDMGVALSAVADEAVTAIEPVLPLALNGEAGSDAVLAGLVTAMPQAEANFARAETGLQAAIAARQQIDADSLSPQVAAQVNRLDRGLPLLQLGLQLAPVLPDMLGATRPMTYLVVAQNNDELRPTGGFISSVGTLTVDKGKIIGLQFEDSYRIDDFKQSYPPAPAPLERYMLAYFWVFRDANWSPDFPTAAQTMLDLYHISRAGHIDGVIALDQLALQEVVAALAPLKIPNWDEPATGDNVLELIRLSWSAGKQKEGTDPKWWRNRKKFVSQLVASARNRIEKQPGSVNWEALISAVVRGFDERHVQMWLANADSQAVVSQLGWDGAIRPAEGDYLMVVDANIGFNKVNAVSETSAQYAVDLTDTDRPIAQLTVIQRNNSRGGEPCDHTSRYGDDYDAIMNRCYWDYVRIYAPAGSRLQKATPHAVPGELLVSGRDEPARVVDFPAEGEKMVWGTLVLIPRGQAVETEFAYSLPPSVVQETAEGRRYRLLVQKQAGTQANSVRVQVALPPGSQILSAEPAPAAVDAASGLVTFELSLAVDREIDLLFQ